jgi:TetR/AcrR family transcriptional repressor of nem operon
MVTHEQDTREQILQAARTLVQTKSYSGFGFQELAETVGIRKASVYYHFASKEVLGVALVVKAQKQITALYESNVDLPGIEQLRAFLAKIGSTIGVGRRMCPGAALTANWGSLPKDLKKSVLQLRDTYLQLLAAMVNAGRRDMTLKIDAAAADEVVAKSIVASFQGGILLARLSGDKADYDTVVESLITSLSQKPSPA